MVNIKAFAIEEWINDHSRTAKYDLSSSCSLPISLDELKSLAAGPFPGSNSDGPVSPSMFSSPMGYGVAHGSPNLRSTIAGLYSVKTPSPLPPENVLITPGASLANFLIFYALCKAGDHVICHYPTYQQLYELPATLGAEVSLWKGKENEKWKLDVEELKGMIKPNTKFIVLNNPQNPTGAIIPRSTLNSVIELAREHSITIISDEVYRPLFHSIGPMDDEFPPSALSLGYDNLIVSSSMSKAYSLAGIRVGWVASRNKAFIDACIRWRSYTTISVSRLDEQIAAFALSDACLHSLLMRNTGLAKRNLPLLEAFVEEHRWVCTWSRPVAGTIAFVKFSKIGKPIDDVAFCHQLLEKTGVLFAPGSTCFGDGENFKGYVRVGFVMDSEALEAGLNLVRKFMSEEYENVPLA